MSDYKIKNEGYFITDGTATLSDIQSDNNNLIMYLRINNYVIVINSHLNFTMTYKFYLYKWRLLRIRALLV